MADTKQNGRKLPEETTGEVTSRRSVVAIVLNYRNYQDTSHCVGMLKRQAHTDLNILVVDNASPNNAYDILVEEFHEDPKVTVIRSDGNNGYAAGNNYGIKRALETSHPRYILIANPDIELPDSETVSKLVDFAESTPAAAAVGPRVMMPDGHIQGPSSRPKLWLLALQYFVLPVWMVLRSREQRELKGLREPRKVFRTVGACLLLRTEDFVAAGMFDEGTFLEGEEDILAERLNEIGKSFYYMPQTTVIHNHSRRYYQHTRAAQKYYFLKYRRKSLVSVTLLLLSSKFYEHVYYPIIKMIRTYRIRKA